MGLLRNWGGPPTRGSVLGVNLICDARPWRGRLPLRGAVKRQPMSSCDSSHERRGCALSARDRGDWPGARRVGLVAQENMRAFVERIALFRTLCIAS
jgi:hypothetical protein